MSRQVAATQIAAEKIEMDFSDTHGRLARKEQRTARQAYVWFVTLSGDIFQSLRRTVGTSRKSPSP